MKHLLSFSICLLIYSSHLSGQEITLAQTDFIKTVFKDKRDVLLSPRYVSEHTLSKIKESLLKNLITRRVTYDGIRTVVDTILVLSNEEIKDIDSILNQFQKYEWTKEVITRFNIPNLTLITNDSINKRSTETLIPTYSILPPIIIKDGNVGIYYSDNSYLNMGLGGGGGLYIYKRINGEWKYAYTIYRWDS